MISPATTRAARRSLFAPLAVLAPCALVLAVAIPALAVSPSRAAPGQAAMQTLTVRASAPNFPKTLSTGLVSLTLINDTKSEVSSSFGHANSGQTLATVKAAGKAANSGTLAGFEQLLKAVTFIGGIDDVQPGASQTAVLRLATPGLYGAGVSPANGPGHTTYFTVTTGAGAAPALPAANVSVTLKDFKFVGLPAHLAAGNTTFQLTNNGTMLHEMQVARLDTGKTQKDVVAFLKSSQSQNGPPPAWIRDAGGMGMISPHQSANVRINLVPGYYLVVCFMPDFKKNGEPHAMEGMIGHFTVS